MQLIARGIILRERIDFIKLVTKEYVGTVPFPFCHTISFTVPKKPHPL